MATTNPEQKELNIVREWSVPIPLTGNIFIFGRIGGGKTCKLLTILQGYHSHGYKIFDMFGGKRNEGPYWSLKNDDLNLWEQLEGETYGMAVEGPKEYKVNLLFPMFSKELPDELPKDGDRVKSKVFTIPIKSLEEKDLAMVLGVLSQTKKVVFNNLMEELDEKSNGEDIKALFDTKFSKNKKDSLYTLFFKPLLNNGLFSSTNSDLNINWIEEAKERGVITVLCMDYVPDKFKFFIMRHIMNTLIKLAMKDKIPKKNIAAFREASAFMKVVDSDKSTDEMTSIFRNELVDLARYARSGMFVAMDSQDSAECKGMIEGSDDILGICEMPGSFSREVTCTPLKRDRRMSDAQIRYISVMPIHQICIVTRGQKAKILKRIQPPRCKYFKSEYGNFFSLWRKEKDTWTKTQNFLDILQIEKDLRDEAVLNIMMEYGKRNEIEESEEKITIEDLENLEDETEKEEVESPEKVLEIKNKKIEYEKENPEPIVEKVEVSEELDEPDNESDEIDSPPEEIPEIKEEEDENRFI